MTPLRAWYAGRRDAYPWRGERDPYRVLVSEVMLQQTQAARVVPLYLAFLERFPTVSALADASRADVVRAWAGLGYNRRAVALSEAARAVMLRHGGRIPSDPAVLRTLPGVGPYTASAVAAFAFGANIPALDVNVRRVVARHRLGREPATSSPAGVHAAATAWLDDDGSDASTWSQALMDLSREVCRPAPRCATCPIARDCAFRTAPPGGPDRRTTRRARFEGSTRQVRGRIVAHLRRSPTASLQDLSEATGAGMERVAGAVASLHRDGLVEASPEALEGLATGATSLAG